MNHDDDEPVTDASLILDALEWVAWLELIAAARRPVEVVAVVGEVL